VDTGMGRLGYIATGNGGDVPLGQVFAGFSSRTMLDVCGVFTHFAASDAADPVTARRQLAVFEQALSELPAGMRDRLCVHAANSAATMVMPGARFDMVRPGIILYGLRPSAEMDTAGFDLRPVMSLKGRIASVKRVPDGRRNCHCGSACRVRGRVQPPAFVLRHHAGSRPPGRSNRQGVYGPDHD
jgi:alanine racemase